jgi:predicted transcriptional regulator
MDVMSVLWDLGSATVADVRERLADGLAYTTVLSALQMLEAKGSVRHEKEGRAYRYHPLVDRRSTGRSELKRLLDKVFQGSPELLIVQLVSDRKLGRAELRRIRERLDERLADEGGET